MTVNKTLNEKIVKKKRFSCRPVRTHLELQSFQPGSHYGEENEAQDRVSHAADAATI